MSGPVTFDHPWHTAPIPVGALAINTLSLRDYLAAVALQGLMGGRWKTGIHGERSDAYREDAPEWAKSAYIFADAMLAERSK